MVQLVAPNVFQGSIHSRLSLGRLTVSDAQHCVQLCATYILLSISELRDQMHWDLAYSYSPALFCLADFMVSLFYATLLVRRSIVT